MKIRPWWEWSLVLVYESYLELGFMGELVFRLNDYRVAEHRIPSIFD